MLDNDLTKPFTPDELGSMVINVTISGRLMAMDINELRYVGEYVVAHNAVDLGPAPCQKLLYLIQSAAPMYQTFGAHYAALQQMNHALETLDKALIDLFEGERLIDVRPMMDTLDKMANVCLDVRRIAEQGAATVSSGMRNQSKQSVDKPTNEG